MTIDLLEYFSNQENKKKYRFCDDLIEVTAQDIENNQDQIIYLIIDNEYRKVISVVGLIAEIE